MNTILKEKTKYEIIRVISKDCHRGVIHTYSVWDSEFEKRNIDIELLERCIKELLKDKIIRRMNIDRYAIGSDFMHEIDPVGRYKYIKGMLTYEKLNPLKSIQA